MAKLPFLLLLFGVACAEVPTLASRPARAPAAAGGGEFLVLRSADPVSILPAGEEGARPLASYEKTFRASRGSWVLVGPGGRAEIAFPDGSFVAASGSCALEVLGPGGGEDLLFRAASAERMTVALRGDARAALPGGALVSGDGARFVARSLGEGRVRVESRGSVPVRIRLGGDEVLLDGARSVDLPARGVPGGGGG
ncbi:MAG TPA: hypothetical protein VFI25_13470 [Planctomycetota bacterium]|nr:hypothetical protein [Planctomycetota bacterium]